MSLDRRTLLRKAALMAPMLVAGRAFATPAATDTRLLVVFLRGAYDAANVVAPTGSDFYFQSRPTIALKKPDPADPEAPLALDADWSLHPALKDSIYALGQDKPISFTDQLPLCFRGGPVIPNLALNTVGAKPAIDPKQAQLIESMYKGNALGPSVQEGFQVRDTVTQALAQEMVAANRGAVSAKGFELSARRIGRLMRDQFNLAFVDVGGWDTHVNQGSANGYLAGRLGELGRGLTGFVDEIGPEDWAKTTVVVVSEFGRTFHENGDKGTDHGHGSVYWVMGGAVRGGQIAGPQVTLGQTTLNQRRDLPVLTDYRSLIGEIVGRRYGLGPQKLQAIFPGVAPSQLNIV